MYFIQFADETKEQAVARSTGYNSYEEAETMAEALLEFEPKGMYYTIFLANKP